MGFFAAFDGCNLGNLTKPTTLCEYDGTIDGAGNLVDISWKKLGSPITRPQLDMSQVGNPTTALSRMEYNENRLSGRRFDGSTQNYTAAHQSCMNIFDSDFTMTILFKLNTTDTCSLFSYSKSAVGIYGVWVVASGGNLIDYRFYKAGGLYLSLSSSIDSGLYHTHQLVRKNNIAYVMYDGIAGSGVDVSGYGIDGDVDLNLGCLYSSALRFNGDILYFRIDTEAMSDQKLSDDYEQIRGLGCSDRGKNPWIFSRSTNAYRKINTGGIFNTGINVPRIGGNGGGLIIEPASTNYAIQSNDLDTTWSKVNLTSVSKNVFTAPDDTQTMDGVVGTADDLQHGVSQAITHTARPWSSSGYWSPGDKDWCKLENSTIANCYAYFCKTGRIGTVGAGCKAKMEADGFRNGVPCYRVQINYTGTAAAHTIKFLAANADGDDDFAGDASTVNSYFWGLQVEPSVLASELIATTTTQVSRAVDSLSKIVSPNILPYVCNATKSPKITIEFEAKFFDNGGVNGAVMLFLLSESSTKNCLSFYKYNGGSGLYWDVFFEDGTEKYCAIAPPTRPEEWHIYKLFLDLSNLVRSYAKIDSGTPAYFLSGTTQSLNFSSATLKYTTYGTNPEGLKIRNLRIDNKEW